MSVQQFIARRYLTQAQGKDGSRGFLRFITYIAIGGVAIGVAALLLALSIVQGFSEEIEAKIIGWGAHVQVSSLRAQPLERADTLAARLRSMDERVVSASPVIEDFALLRVSASEIDGVVVVGRDELPDYIASTVEADSAQNVQSSGPSLTVGRQLAQQLGIEVGDSVTLFSMRGDSGRSRKSALFEPPRVKQFAVTGVFETSLAEYDQLYVFTSMEEARVLLGLPKHSATRVDVRLSAVTEAPGIADLINDTWGFPFLAETIYDVRRPLFAWVELQEQMIPLVLSVIMLVGAFNIIGTLLMIILEKTRAIGIMIGMGTTRKHIRRLFLRLGLYIGIIGTVIGEVIALLLALVQLRFGIITLPAEAYYLSVAPIALDAVHFIIVAIVAIGLCSFAALIPAHFAARIEPIRAIRFQ